MWGDIPRRSVSRYWSPATLATVTPATVTAAAAFPAPVVTGNCAIVAAATVTATATVLSPSVSPPRIFHVADSAVYTGTDISPVVAYNSGAGNTLVAVITAYTTGNYPAACNGVFDDTLNTWTITDGGGSYDASTGLYGFTTIATCVSALPITLITVYFNANNNYILYGAGASVQVSEFAGLPLGSTPQVIATASPDAHTGAYTAPGVTVPDGAYLILSAVAASATWTSVSPGTAVNGTQGSWSTAASAGSYAPAYTGATQTVYGAVTVAFGAATPTGPALFTPVGGWLGAATGPLNASYHGAGHLVVVKVTNTSDGAVYCTGLTSSGATWVQAGNVFTGTVNAMTTVAFFGTVVAAGQDIITPTWSGATPGSWSMAGHEFIATAGWRLLDQGTLDSTGTSNWPGLTPAKGGELYFGHATDTGQPAAGSTPGYVYTTNVNTVAPAAAYNASVPGPA